MEINQQPASSETSNQGGGRGGVPAGNSDEQTLNSPTTTQASRLYECSFCKKGFSNAQALGGHMNIHRKDKAKLKQASSKDNHNHNNQRFLQQDSHQGGLMSIPLTTPSKTINSKWPPSTNFSSDHHNREEDHYTHESQMAELKQLPLFVDQTTSRISTTTTEYPNTINVSSGHGQGSFGGELDLELRLGHEPSKSSVAMGTRKFF